MSVDSLKKDRHKVHKCETHGNKIHRISLFSIFRLSLSTQIVVSFIIGAMIGIALRYKPDLFSFVGLNAMSFRHLGDLFIKMVKMIAMPLIFACVLQSVISLRRKASTGKTAVLTIVVFISMTIICVSSGALFTSFFQPGANVAFDKASFFAQYSAQEGVPLSVTEAKQISIVEFLFSVVPSNIFVSFYHSNFLQIIFFAILFAIGISKVDEKGNIYRGIKTLARICAEVVQIVMKFAPFGTFGITVWLGGSQDLALLKSIGKLVCVDWACSFFVIYIVFSLTTIVVLRLKPTHLWKKLFSTQFIAFLTASSASVLPSGMKIARERLGVSEEKINFIAPFSAAVNSSGGAMYFAIITIFMIQLFDINLSTQQYITLFMMCALCDLGVAPVPGGSLIMLGNVFVAVGIPIEALCIAFAVDRMLDMSRTLVNFTGDIYSAVVVDKLSNTMDAKTYAK